MGERHDHDKLRARRHKTAHLKGIALLSRRCAEYLPDRTALWHRRYTNTLSLRGWVHFETRRLDVPGGQPLVVGSVLERQASETGERRSDSPDVFGQEPWPALRDLFYELEKDGIDAAFDFDLDSLIAGFERLRSSTTD